MSLGDPSHSLSRREFLGRSGKAIAAGAAAAGTLPGLASGANRLLEAATAGPKRGGTLSMSMITGGKSETLVPGFGVTEPDIARSDLLFDPLFRLAPDLTPKPALAESAEPSKKGKVWTVRIRPGARWHNGKPVTADDLVYSIRQWANPKVNYAAAPIVALVDVKNVRKRDNRTVEIPMKVPVGDFPTVSTYYQYSVIPNGMTVKEIARHPIGTGPFKYKSFRPGSQSVFLANKEYWHHGGPYVDELVIDSSFSDDTARLNALLSGQNDLMPTMPFALAKQQQSSHSITLLNGSGTAFQTLAMRVDKAPFNDVRVRQALKLIPKRQDYVDRVMNGFGRVGHDLPCPGAHFYNTHLHRHQDIEKAKSLLKAAGHSNLRITLNASNVVDGLLQASALFQQDAKEAGVTVDVNRIDPTSYFTVGGGHWLDYPFSATFWVNGTAGLPLYYLNTLWRHASYNETHWGSASADKLLFDAIGEVNPAKAQEKWDAVQELQFNQGGYLVYSTMNYVDGVANRIHGLKASRADWLGNYNLVDAWIS